MEPISDSNNDCLYSYDCCDIAPCIEYCGDFPRGKNAIAKGLVGVWPKEFTLEAYKMVFQNNNIVHSLFYSIFLTLGSALLSTFMTILAAYPLSKSDLRGDTYSWS